MKTISETHTFSQNDFDRFADISGDDNPIHVDPAFAAQMRFGRTVAHGMLLASVIWSMVRRHLRDTGCQLSQSLMFPNPAYAGEALNFTVSVENVTSDHLTLGIRVARLADGVVTCQGSTEFALGERA